MRQGSTLTRKVSTELQLNNDNYETITHCFIFCHDRACSIHDTQYIRRIPNKQTQNYNLFQLFPHACNVASATAHAHFNNWTQSLPIYGGCRLNKGGDESQNSQEKSWKVLFNFSQFRAKISSLKGHTKNLNKFSKLLNGKTLTKQGGKSVGLASRFILIVFQRRTRDSKEPSLWPNLFDWPYDNVEVDWSHRW